MLKINDKAPEFILLSDQNKKISLKDFKGKQIVLYFYPKDDTPGCTLESCGFRDAQNKFEKCNTQILGISKDTVESHVKFKNKYDLTFPLLADSEGTVCEMYGILKEKSMFGKKYLGIERSTFLIDATGKIKYIWRNVKVSGHIEAVLKMVSSHENSGN